MIGIDIHDTESNYSSKNKEDDKNGTKCDKRKRIETLRRVRNRIENKKLESRYNKNVQYIPYNYINHGNKSDNSNDSGNNGDISNASGNDIKKIKDEISIESSDIVVNVNEFVENVDKNQSKSNTSGEKTDSKSLDELTSSDQLYITDSININYWTKDIEDEIVYLSELCESDSEKIKRDSKMNNYIEKSLQISLILLGATSVALTSIYSVEVEQYKILQSIIGSSISIITSIKIFFGFGRKSAIAGECSIKMNSLSRKLRLQVISPYDKRVDPFDLIIEVENERDRTLKKIG